MIIHDRCFCDLCGQLIGQLWNQPAQAPDLLPSDTHRECVDCKARTSQCEPEVVQ